MFLSATLWSVSVHADNWPAWRGVNGLGITRVERFLERLGSGAKIGHAAGLEVHAGHGLDFDTARRLAATPEFVEFNIGHFLMGEALFCGLPSVIKDMRRAMDEGRGLP